MKRCPSCQQSYPDDAPDYCSNDGNRLVNEEAATFDPEQTVMASGLRGGEPAAVWLSGPPERDERPRPSSPEHPPAQGQQGSEGTSREQSKSELPPKPWQPQVEQYPQTGGTAQPAPNWGGAPYPQTPPHTPYPEAYPPALGGRSRALAIAALVTGTCAATIMAMWVVRSADFVFTSMLILGILGIVLGVASLFLALQKPFRFGGVPLAIVGLATGTAALVYYFTL